MTKFINLRFLHPCNLRAIEKLNVTKLVYVTVVDDDLVIIILFYCDSVF